jgi:hypothetical protein
MIVEIGLVQTPDVDIGLPIKCVRLSMKSGAGHVLEPLKSALLI